MDLEKFQQALKENGILSNKSIRDDKPEYDLINFELVEKGQEGTWTQKGNVIPVESENGQAVDIKQTNENFKDALEQEWNVPKVTFGSTISPIARFRLEAMNMTEEEGVQDFLRVLDNSLNKDGLKRSAPGL